MNFLCFTDIFTLCYHIIMCSYSYIIDVFVLF